MRKLSSVLIFAATVVLLLLGCFWSIRFFLYRDIFRKEAELASPGVASVAGRDLAVLCQTCRLHPEWFGDEPPLAPAWTPASLLKFEPSWVDVQPDSARVEFGGGFHHFGYSVELATPAKDDRQFTWVLSLYREGWNDREIARFNLTPDDVLTESEFVDRTWTELDRRIDGAPASHRTNDSSVQRCQFAIKHKRIDRLKRSIRESARSNPDNWQDVLLAHIIDSATDRPAATQRLRAWSESKGDFSAWLFAAFAFDHDGRTDEMEQAVERACKFPANDPVWVSGNARYRGYAMCRRLFSAGRFRTCTKLCETLLAYDASGGYLAGEILAIRNACQSGQSSIPGADEVLIFDPFAGIDLNALRSAAIPTADPPASATQP